MCYSKTRVTAEVKFVLLAFLAASKRVGIVDLFHLKLKKQEQVEQVV